jgi:hypothetical protein
MKTKKASSKKKLAPSRARAKRYGCTLGKDKGWCDGKGAARCPDNVGMSGCKRG